jgi:hypothetical protein
LPGLFARSARAQGHAVVWVGEAEASLAHDVDSLTWLKLGRTAASDGAVPRDRNGSTGWCAGSSW